MAGKLAGVFLIFALSGSAGASCSWQTNNHTFTYTIRSSQDELRDLEIAAYPPYIEHLEEDRISVIHLNVTTWPQGVNTLHIQVNVDNRDIVKVQPNVLTLNRDDFSGNVTVTGIFLGRTTLYFSVYGPDGSNASHASGTYTPAGSDQGAGLPEPLPFEVSVIRAEGVLDKIFIGVVSLLIIMANMGMGCKIKLSEVKEILVKPVAPLIGFACQFIVMPLLAYGFALMLGLEGGAALGFFAAGCAPGGGASNIYTYLVRGDVALSVTMTLISTTLALGMVPLWLYTLGHLLMRQLDICLTIPFTNIFITLICIIIPVGCGLLLQHYQPSWAKNIRKILRPLSIFFIVFVFTFGVYANLYMFKLFTWDLILAGCLLPYCGFLVGMVVAGVTCRSAQQIRTIAIETGIQNSGVAILLMKYSLPQPESDIAMVPPVIVSTFTPIPMIIMVIGFEVYFRCYKKQARLDDDENHNGIYKGLPIDSKSEMSSGLKIAGPIDDTTPMPVDDRL